MPPGPYSTTPSSSTISFSLPIHPSPSTTSNNNATVINMAANTHNTLYPALYLYPLNDTWAPKHIALTSVHTKIGRQTSSKTAPGEKNGFFDSKVLSRQHAEVWEEGGKIYIKDVKSSNGTFINGERLSSEGHESDPFELKSDDIVEFGIDIVGEDNKTIIHHKVAARVVCVFSEQDAQVAARAEQHQHQQQLQQQQFLQQQQQSGSHGATGLGAVGVVGGAGGVGGQINGLGVGGVGGNAFPQYSVQRRAQLAQQGLGAMAGMRAPGKSGLTFDVVMSRLQGELQKSRETGAELTSLSGALNEINDTLSGNLPASVPQFPSKLPPVRPPQEAPPAAPGQSSSPIPAASAAPTGALPPPPTASVNPPAPAVTSTSSTIIDPAAIAAIQTQLEATQSSLASQNDKLKVFEDALADQDKMRREVERLREVLIERGTSGFMSSTASSSSAPSSSSMVLKGQDSEASRGFKIDEESAADIDSEIESMELTRRDDDAREEYDYDDDDDARSISTVMGHELERVDEEDEGEESGQGRELDDSEDRGRMDEERGVGVEHHSPSASTDDDHVETDQEREEQALRRAEEEDEREREERRREDLGVGRPRTPEPGRLWLFGNAGGQRRASVGKDVGSSSTSSAPSTCTSTSTSTSLLASTATDATAPPSWTTSPDELQAQIKELTNQVNAFAKLAGSLEERHLAAQEVIKRLEGKVRGLEIDVQGRDGVDVEEPVKEEEMGEVKVEEEAEVNKEEPHQEPEAIAEEPTKADNSTPTVTPVPGPSLIEAVTPLLTEWRKSFEAQISHDLSAEREKMDRAREEWERRAREVDERVGRMEETQRILSGSVANAVALATANSGYLNSHGNTHALGMGLNGDGPKFGHGSGAGGLVTPPSPRSQSSDSGRYARRRRRRAVKEAAATVVDVERTEGGVEKEMSGSDSFEGLSSESEVDDVNQQSEEGFEKGGLTRNSSGDGDEEIDEGMMGSVLSSGSTGSAVVAAMIGAMPLGVGMPSSLGVSHSHQHGGVGVGVDVGGTRAVLATDDGVRVGGGALIDPTRALATPAPSDRMLEGSVDSLEVCGDDEEKERDIDDGDVENSTTPDLKHEVSRGGGVGRNDNLNVQTAVGVMLLSIAAAAVFWKIRPET